MDKNGSVYVSGLSDGNGTFGDFATIKYDSNGVVKWINRYNGQGRSGDEVIAMAVDESGNVYVTGGSGGDYATIKYDANGNQLWVATYNGPENGEDRATALALDPLGNVYVTGRSLGQNIDYATVKYNSAGVQQWSVRYETPGFDLVNDIAVDASGNVYVTGGNATVKYSIAGVQQWVALYNGFARALVLDPLGNVYVTGSSGGDFATVKYNPSGVQQWAIRYDGPGHSDDAATGIALDASGNVYVTGGSIGNGSEADYTTIKYEQVPLLTRTATIPEQNNSVNAEKASVKLNAKAFPNAFTDFINLQWSGSDKTVNITITDMLGRLVEKRTNLAASGTIQAGYRFPAGTYYAEIVQGTEKVLLKIIKH